MHLGGSNQSREQALREVLKVTATRSGKALVYTTALVGMAALAPGWEMPPELSAIAGSIGVEAMWSLLSRVANDELSEEEIVTAIERTIGESGIDALLTKEDFYHAFAHLRKGQRTLSHQNRAILQVVRHLEETVSRKAAEEGYALREPLERQTRGLGVFRLGAAFHNFWFIAHAVYGLRRNEITPYGIGKLEHTKRHLCELLDSLGFEITVPDSPEQLNLLYDTKPLDSYEDLVVPKDAVKKWHEITASRLNDYCGGLGKRYVSLFHLGYALSQTTEPRSHDKLHEILCAEDGRETRCEKLMKEILSHIHGAGLSHGVFEQVQHYIEEIRLQLHPWTGDEKFGQIDDLRDEMLGYVGTSITSSEW